MKTFLFFCSLFLLQNTTYANTLRNRTDTCKDVLHVYSKYWKKDKGGKNGFREIFGSNILAKCNCIGVLWNDIKEDLGKPNYVYSENDSMRYRYRLNHLTKNFKDIGSLLLDIIVNKDGVIVYFSVWRVDG